MFAVKKYSTLLLLIMIGSCSKLCTPAHIDMNPEQVVEAYLNQAFNMTNVSQRVDLMKYTRGPLRSSIEAASDQTIKEAYIDKRYMLERYSIVERRDRTPRETEITFETVYKQLEKDGSDDESAPNSVPTVTTENTVSVIRDSKIWYINDVLNKKSSFDFPISQDSEIKVKAP